MPVEETPTTGSNGVTVKIPKIDAEITVSEGATHTLVGAYEATLHWAETNPFEFWGVLLLVAFGLWQRRLRKQNIARMKNDFKEARNGAQQQLQLPLEPPESQEEP